VGLCGEETALRADVDRDQGTLKMNMDSEIRFGEWTLHRPLRELQRNGVRLRLQDRPFQVLDELLRHPGEVITREQLIARLWPKRVVDFDTALNAAVRRLRAAVGDEAETPRYIETVPRIGYRFIGVIEREAISVEAPAVSVLVQAEPSQRAPSGRSPYSWRWGLRLAAAGIVLAVVGAVLPVDRLRPAPDLQPLPNELAHDTHKRVAERVLRAHFFVQRRGTGDLERAEQLYREAVSVDPRSARAWSGLATVHWLQTVEGAVAREIGLPKVRDAAERALALDPSLAEAHLRMALYLECAGEESAAHEHRRRAAELEPNNPLLLGLSASDAAAAGRWDEAVELQRRAVAADPLSVINRGNLSAFLLMAGQYDEARVEFARVRELSPNEPDDVAAFALILQGRAEEALPLVEAWPKSAARAQCLALIHHALRRKADSDAALQDLIAMAGEGDSVRIAEVHAFRGESADAFHWLNADGPERRKGTIHFSPFLRVLDHPDN
jgi:DNA-binding winged helix-turn-helix (wHTH) protein/Tfp pilus assembly protein PilF